MATAIWPPSLQQNLDQSGYSEQERTNVISSSPEVGPPLTRRRDAATYVDINGSIAVSLTEYNTLQNFFKDTLKDGALLFDWVHPITGDAVEMRFKSAPKYSALSGSFFKAMLELEVQP